MTANVYQAAVEVLETGNQTVNVYQAAVEVVGFIGAVPPKYPYYLTLVNPGFETGDSTGWSTSVGSGFSVRSDGPHSGTYYAMASSSGVYARSYQTVDFPPDVLDDVDAGLIKMSACYWQNGYPSDGDNGGADVEFFSGAGGTGSLLALVGVPNIDPTEWTFREIASMVPRGTRSIRLNTRGVRTGGANNDCYFDDFDVILDLKGKEHATVISFDGAEASGWTFTSGTSLSVIANVGGGPWWSRDALVANSQAAFSAYRTAFYSVPEGAHSDVDAGGAKLQLSCWIGSDTAPDQGRVWIEAFNGSDTSLGVVAQTAASNVTLLYAGIPYIVNGALPAGTRKLRLHLSGNRLTGAATDVYATNIVAQVEASGIGDTPPSPDAGRPVICVIGLS